MTHTQAIKTINDAYWKLERACEHTHDWDRYVELVRQAEKDHRRFKPAGLTCGLTLAQATRLFVVKEVFERFVPAHSAERIFTPEATDYFSVRQDVFAACAIAHKCGEQIIKTITHTEMQNWLAAIDYAELNKDRRVAV